MFNNYIDKDIVIFCQLANGKAKATLKRDHILKTTLGGNVNPIDNIEQLVKNFIYVAVTVLTETGEWIMSASKFKSKNRVNICS